MFLDGTLRRDVAILSSRPARLGPFGLIVVKAAHSRPEAKKAQKIMPNTVKGQTIPFKSVSPPSPEGGDARAHREPETHGPEDQLSGGPTAHEGSSSPPAASAPTPRRPSSRAGSVNMQAPSVKPDSVPQATAEVVNVRETASGQVLTLRFAPGGPGAQGPFALYEVAVPRGALGGIAEADHSSLAQSLAKLIQAAEDQSAKRGKPLTSFTFTKPSHHGAPPSLILVLDKGAQKDTVDLSQESDFQPSYLKASLHTELRDVFEHLHACLHLPAEQRVHAKITRLGNDEVLDETTKQAAPHA